jgi:DNA-binding NarL/FixJ family response regulator
MIDVLIVDDNPIVRAALRTFLEISAEVRVLAEAGDGEEAVEFARRLHPTVILLDYRMPIADGLSVLPDLAAESAVLVLTSDDAPELIDRMLRKGARGYLVHGEFDPDELLRAVRAVANGNSWLSPAAAAVATRAVRDIDAHEREATAAADRLREHRQRLGLTRREEEVLALVAEGLTNLAIARRLVVNERTVRNHLNHIYAKLHVTNRTEAVLLWSGDRTAD